ncbi:hypothetical protein ABZ874_24160 [Streptomyces albidoflavus]|uniref:hypothetical protein n=1 Tax=Streptomyces albidoflavus TaxID=1886 RepID=UPI0033D85628
MEIQDQRLVDAMWCAADLTGAYLAGDRQGVVTCTAGVDADGLDHLLAWLIMDHDMIFDDLGEPAMGLPAIDALAALAPAELEFAATTALRRVARRETGLTDAVAALARPEQIHTIAVCTAVMLLEAYGRPGALNHLAELTSRYPGRDSLG